MRNLATRILLFLVVTLTTACNQSQQMGNEALSLCDKKATAETVRLYRELKEKQKIGIMLGHQDALAYGNNWFLEEGRSDVKSVCGDYPAVFGWNIGNIENKELKNQDSIPFATIISYVRIVEQWGGISTFIWPAGNPVTGRNSNEKLSKDAVKQILENEAIQKQFLTSLDKVANFFNQLTDEKGRPIPVIFQPFHGHNAKNALWWNTKSCTADDFKELWKMTINYLRNEKGIHHILYAYSVYGDKNINTFESYYPGNDYVDIIGLNSHWLQDGDLNEQDFIRELNRDISIITHFAEKNDKIPAITSTGMEGIKISNFFSEYLYPVISQYKLSYILFEKNAWNQEKHYFIPVPGHPASEDFVRFVDYPNILTCKDMKE